MPEVSRSRTGSDFGMSLFVAAIFSSAFLIFLVQPMVGKRILPWFGGVPSAWTVCLSFYQVTLFLGYAYAHGLIRLVRPSVALGVHVLLVGAALVALPVLPGQAWVPEASAAPVASIMAMLFATVALPFLTLAATGPLVQAWFARRYPERSPYRLYAVSNIGSLLALLGYPFLIEPRLSLLATGQLWSFGFAITAVMVLGCSVLAWRSGGVVQDTAVAAGAAPDLKTSSVVLWLLLSGTAVVLLMGTTNKLCIDIASVPFLWVLPLAAYLISFILCFGFERSYRRVPYIALTALILFVQNMGPAWLQGATHLIQAQIPLHCLLLFSVCMVMHGELYRLRPPPRSLTAFYLCVSGGGAIGGILVGIVAPLVLDGFHELPLGLALAWLLVLVARWYDSKGWLHAGVPGWRWFAVAAVSAALLAYSGARVLDRDDTLRYRERTFFGVLRIREVENQHHLFSGTTLHGVQFRKTPETRRMATSYFGAATGIAVALQPRPDGAARRVGVVGLGVGTLAAYGRAGDLFRFYEIDPAVIRLATDERFFSFLGDSEADIELVSGDARLSLIAEHTRGAEQNFDVLVLDAFSSDSIPVHLLTQEAFQVYDAALKRDGLIAVHTSNNHFDLWPLVSQLGQGLGMNGLWMKTTTAHRWKSLPAVWIFLSRDEKQLRILMNAALARAKEMDLAAPRLAFVRSRGAQPRSVRVWTDDYSDLFGLLRR